MLLSQIQARLDKAKDAYLREVAAVDRALQGVVRVDPSHLEAAVAIQETFSLDPDVLELKANEQPDIEAAADAPSAAEAPKAKRPRDAKPKK